MLLTTSAANPVLDAVPERFRSASLDDLERAAREAILAAGRDRAWLVIAGPVGRGKTHAMAAACNAASEGLGFVSWIDFLETIRAFWKLKTDDARRFDPMRWAERVPALYLDDVGTEESRGNVELGGETFPAIVNARYHHGRPTAITTNLTIAELGERYGSRTASRLAECATWIEMRGADRRLA